MVLADGIKAGTVTEADRKAYVEAWSQPGALTGGLNYYRAAAVGPPPRAAAPAATTATTTAAAEPRRAAGDQPPSLVVRVPTLVIWGEKDTALLTGNLDGLDQVVPKLTVRRIPDGTHWVVREKPADVNGLIREFLAQKIAMAATAPRFSAETLRFLRALKRNNRREWFNAHRDDYETHVRQPMTAIVERLADDFRAFAPELVASPKAVDVSHLPRYAILRQQDPVQDPHRRGVSDARARSNTRAPASYFHISPDEVWVGGGMYSPQPAQLYAVREHIAANTRQLRAIVESPGFRRHVGRLEGEQLKRVPRGFPKDHEAAEYLKHRQFIAGAEFPATFATSPKLYGTLLTVFRQVIPLCALPERAAAERSGDGADVVAPEQARQNRRGIARV